MIRDPDRLNMAEENNFNASSPIPEMKHNYGNGVAPNASISEVGIRMLANNYYNNWTNMEMKDNSADQMTSFVTVTSEDIISRMNETQFRILTPSFILVLILLFLGVLGNIIALIVYITKMKRSTASYFIITLAFSDLINCVFTLPVELYLISHFWTFDFPWLCKFSRFLTAAMNNTSSFILAAIAVERFRSICLPLKPRATSICTKYICVTLCICALLTAIPMIFGYGTFTIKVTVYNVTVDGKTCLIDDHLVNTYFPTLLLSIFLVGHLTVFLILSVLYFCIARKLLSRAEFEHSEMTSKNMLLKRQTSTYSITSFTFHSRTSVRNVSPETDQTSEGKRKLIRSSSSMSNRGYNLSRKHGGPAVRTKRLTCMLFLVTSVFEISFIPYLVIVCLRTHYPNMYESLSDSSKMAYQFFLRSYLINSAMNPVIYCFYNQNFRHGVKRLFYSFKELLLPSTMP